MTALETLSDKDYVDAHVGPIVSTGLPEVAAREIGVIASHVDFSETNSLLAGSIDPDEVVANLIHRPAEMLRREFNQMRRIYRPRTMAYVDDLGSQVYRLATRNAEMTRIDSEYSLTTTQTGNEYLRITSRLQGQSPSPVTVAVRGDDVQITTRGWHRGEPKDIVHSLEPGGSGENLLMGVLAVTTLAQCMYELRTPEEAAAASEHTVSLHHAYDQQRRTVLL